VEEVEEVILTIVLNSVMVEQEEVPQWIGMWWAHLVLGLIGLTLLARESGWFARSPAEVGT